MKKAHIGSDFDNLLQRDSLLAECEATARRRVDDSEPEAEFQEAVNKSKAMLKAVALAETFAKSP
jgi:hypothetical protein